MFDSTVVKMCSLLTKPELAALRKVVRSPYFNGKEEVSRLFEYLADNVGGKPAKLERTTVEKYVFQNQKNIPSDSINRVASALTDIIRDWLAIEEMRLDGNQIQLYLQHAYKRRGMTEFREKALPQAIAENDRQPLRDLQYHYRQCVLNWDRFDHVSKVKWENQQEFQSMTEQQAYYLLTKIIKLGCLGAAFETRLGKKFDMLFLDEAVRYVEEKNLMDIPAVSTFYHVYKVLKNEDSGQDAQHIRRILQQGSGKFSNSDLQFIIGSLTSNLLQRHVETGDAAYLRESFELYRIALENGVLTPNKFISKYLYYNLTSQAIALGESEWALNFIENYKKLLPESGRENTYQFHLALHHFHSKNFDEAVKLLQKIIVRDEVLYNLEARAMMICILYETGAHDSANYQLQSFTAFLRRHPEVGGYREAHQNFIKLAQKLLKIKPADDAARQSLAEEISNAKNLWGKTWLLEHVSPSEMGTWRPRALTHLMNAYAGSL